MNFLNLQNELKENYIYIHIYTHTFYIIKHIILECHAKEVL